jgi:hypothetical protein
MKDSLHRQVQSIELDTSADEQDDLNHFTGLIDVNKNIGHSTMNEQLATSTYVVYPLTTESPLTSKSERKLEHYATNSRRNTFNLIDSPSLSSSNDDKQILVNTKHNYVRLNSEGFDPHIHGNVFHDVLDARSTFSLPRRSCRRLTHQVIIMFIVDVYSTINHF